MSKVKVLPEEVVQQIAAGEVVERPASVVKELVENSLDAGASRVEVTLERSGLDLIVVRDNGEGMLPEDALLAFTRHATSKISSAADLFAVQSFGFRGEALPSIAAVSRLELTTAVSGAVNGVKITNVGGTEPVMTPCAAAPGTTVRVEQLFYNTPARFKFLKSEQTELKHIVEVLTRLAVVRPDVSLRATNAGRELISTSGAGDRSEVVAMVLGKGADVTWLPVEGETPLFRVTGWLAPSEFARGTRGQQIIIVNGRWVKSTFLALAVEAGYGPFLVSSRHPVFCLEIETEPGLVDVNVHPAKLEVRLSHEQELKGLIHQSVRQALRRGMRGMGIVDVRMPEQSVGDNTVRQAALVREPALDYPAPRVSVMPSPVLSPARPPAAPVSVGKEAEAKKVVTWEVSDGSGFALSAITWPRLALLGQALATYLVATGPEGIYLVDQHAAHERVIFEKLAREFKEGAVAVQHLLVPQTLTVTEPELAVWRANRDVWRQFGLDLEEFGDQTLVLRTIPQVLPLSGAMELVRELLDQTGADSLWKERLHTVQSFLACHAAIRAGQSLTTAEANELLEQLAGCEHPYNCPHGRPTIVCVSRRELDKRFLRQLS